MVQEKTVYSLKVHKNTRNLKSNTINKSNQYKFNRDISRIQTPSLLKSRSSTNFKSNITDNTRIKIKSFNNEKFSFSRNNNICVILQDKWKSSIGRKLSEVFRDNRISIPSSINKFKNDNIMKELNKYNNKINKNSFIITNKTKQNKNEKNSDSDEVNDTVSLQNLKKYQEEQEISKLMRSKSYKINMNIKNTEFFFSEENKINFLQDIYKVPHFKNKIGNKIHLRYENVDKPEDRNEFEDLLFDEILESLKVPNNYEPSVTLFINILKKKYQDKLDNKAKHELENSNTNDEKKNKVTIDHHYLQYFQYKYDNYISSIKFADNKDKEIIMNFANYQKKNLTHKFKNLLNFQNKLTKGRNFEEILSEKVKDSEQFNTEGKNLKTLKDILKKIQKTT